MDFKLVIEKLLSAFKEHNVRYALMGGFALGIWGGSRSTVDLDFLVYRDDMEKVHKIMTGLGYESHQHTENVSQYISPLKVLGGIDFVHAFREASVGMLQRAVEKNIFGDKLKVKTLTPEDIIGLKLQGVYNNPAREKVDIADIEMLVSLHGKNLDWELVERYFTIFKMEDLYKKLREDSQE